MKVTLIKKFGIHEQGEVLDVNIALKKHLLAGGFIEVKKVKTKSKK